MAENVHTEGPPNMAALVGGIINDAQQLIRQEITLARSELRHEWDKTKAAALNLATGGVIAFVGVFLLLFGLVHLLHWASGAVDPAAVPLWGWFLIVGGVLGFVGGALLFRGIQKAGEIQVPPPQTTDSLKEIL
jgi:Putative Actinobacterial Holin-X, holin superfamily III